MATAQEINNMKDKIVAMKPDDINKTFLRELFANKTKKVVDKSGKIKCDIIKSKFEPEDLCTLKKGEYINKSDIQTTLGRLIFNKFMIEDLYGKAFHDYINIVMDGDTFKDVDATVALALMEDKITSQEFIKYINKTQWLGFTLTAMLSSSFTKNLMQPNPKVIKRREELLKEHADDIEKGNITVITKIEDELVSLAKEELKNDEGMNLFNSKARGSFGNNYKNINIMKGPILNFKTGKYETVKGSYMDGISKEDIPASSNSVVAGAYPKAVGQRSFGYMTKQISSALQSTSIKENSYCGTKLTLPIKIDKSNKSLLMYRYINDGGKRVLLDSNTMGKYIGKDVNMYSPMLCAWDACNCSVCVGESYAMLHVDNYGMTSSRVSTTLSNASMKKFHDTTVKVTQLNKFELTF